jgi:glycosyltransferase involved in cell wall biosynthesis
MRDVTLVTPTADQPTGIALCERWMVAQTAWDRVAQWLVVDDGQQPTPLTMDQRYVRREREADCTPERSLCANLMAALPLVETEYVAIIEHDDFYFPDYLATLMAHLAQDGVLIAGDDEQRYYNVATRQWQLYDNWRGGSLYQTGLRRETLPKLREAAEVCFADNWRGVDARLWGLVPAQSSRTYRAHMAVGIKGLPGRPGIGIGHRPDETWNDDPGLTKLYEWAGEYAETYACFWEEAAA